MKKYLLFLSAATLCATVFTSCEKDSDEIAETKPLTTQGVYVVNSGNQWNAIDGSLTAYNPATSVAASGDAFAAANSRSLGGTPNDGIVYGSKMYIVVDGESRVEVVNANTLKSIKAISTVELLGENAGFSPRHIVANNGTIYVSTYGGMVAAIDTTDFSLKASYTVGSYPEGLAIVGNTLYVANSDYGMAQNASLTAINLASGATTEIKDDLIKNPSTLVAVGNALYIVDGDVYGGAPDYAIISQGGLRKLENGTVSQVMDGNITMGANQVATYDGKVYIMYDSYWEPKMKVIDPAAGTTFVMPFSIKEGTAFEMGLVNGLGIDQTNGDIYTLCYHVNAETGYGDYSSPGYANRFNKDGEFIGSFATGVGPTAVIFNQQ
ncbi:MAG: hypothetical protein J5486_01365 [Bacteroidaceae bacterium]|nr:hypothetical protein [Bacteroidaceae bacterium]